MTHRTTTPLRLKAGGYAWVEGWVPAAYAKRVMEQVDMHREDVKAVGKQPLPRGRPKKGDPT